MGQFFGGEAHKTPMKPGFSGFLFVWFFHVLSLGFSYFGRFGRFVDAKKDIKGRSFVIVFHSCSFVFRLGC